MSTDQGNQGGIVRVVKDAKYFSASNEVFNDKRISWETRGLMGYLLSKPNDWTMRMTDLLKQGPAKEFKLRRMLAEARLYGYMSRIRVAQEDGTFDWITNVYESPNLNPAPSKGFIKVTSSRFSTSGSSTSGKPRDVLNTDSQNTESDDDESMRLKKALGERTATFTKLYEANIGLITPLVADMILDAVVDYPAESWYAEAMKVAVANNGRSMSYVLAILKGWKEHYFGWKPEFKQKGVKNGVKKSRSTDAPADNAASPSEEYQRAADAINAHRAAKKAAGLPTM